MRVGPGHVGTGHAVDSMCSTFCQTSGGGWQLVPGLTVQTCDPKHVVQAKLSQLVKHVLRPLPPVPDHRIARGHLLTFEARQLANTVWALASLGLHAPALYHAAGQQLRLQIPRASDKAIAAVADTYTQPIVRASTTHSGPLHVCVLHTVQQRVASGAILPSTLALVLWCTYDRLLAAVDAAAVRSATNSGSLHGAVGRWHALLDDKRTSRECQDGPDSSCHEAGISHPCSAAYVSAAAVPLVGAHLDVANDQLAANIQTALHAIYDELGSLPANVRRPVVPLAMHHAIVGSVCLAACCKW
jgi:hypothetical protein